MRKFISALLIAFWLLFIYTPAKVKAVIIFSDSFSGGYNSSLWTLRSDSLIPVPTSFGIGDTNLSSLFSYILISTAKPSVNQIIKVDMKINSSPSNLVVTCKRDVTGTNAKQLKLLSDGTFDLEHWVNGNGGGNGQHPWDNSPGIHSIELNCIGTNMIFKEDGQILSSWDDGFNFIPDAVGFYYGHGNSEFANYLLCDENGCDGPPVTPPPSPTPPPTTKVVLVPGLGASWNQDALWNCKADGYTGDWTPVSFALSGNPYDPLMTDIEQSGLSSLLFSYDWRKQASDTARLLSEFIENQTVENERVHAVGHSLGGLVARNYLEQSGNAHLLDRFMTVGSPHKGTAYAYPAWSAGEIWNADFFFRMYLTILINRCMSTHGITAREAVRTYVPAVQNLLPIENYLRDNQTNTLTSVLEMDAQNNWLPSNNFALPFYDATVGTLSGRGKQTLQTIKVKEQTPRDAREGNWLDGRPLTRENSNEGDGTVLTDSSIVPGADNTVLSLDHLELVTDPLGRGTIVNFLDGSATQLVQNYAFPKPTSALVLLLNGATAWVTSPDGITTRDSEGLLVFLNPKKGIYRLVLQPKNFSAEFIVAQFLTDGRTFWKEYIHNSILPKFGSIFFDPSKTLEDILK